MSILKLQKRFIYRKEWPQYYTVCKTNYISVLGHLKKKDLAYATPATTIWHLCKTNKTVTYHVNAKVNFKLHFDSDGTSIFHIVACYRRPNRIVVQSLVTDMRFSSFFLHHILQSIGQYHGWLKSAELYYKNRNWSTVLPYGKGSVYTTLAAYKYSNYLLNLHENEMWFSEIMVSMLIQYIFTYTV